MPVFKWIGRKLKDLSPAAIREIIVIILLLCISVALSIPEYISDREKAAVQKETLKSSQTTGGK